jgi:NhaP-type Na+/H+ or K+/H+ antiporter
LLTGFPLSLPIVSVALGFVAVRTGLIGQADLAIIDQSDFATVITEVVVIVAIMGAGIKLDRPFSWRGWASAWRLLGITMPLTILGVASLAHWGGGFGWAEALLIAAALAPTDPVLASDIGVGPPGVGEEGEFRFAVTAEAGVNDGLALPFVSLAVLMATQEKVTAGWLAGAIVGKIVIAVVIGYLVGRLFGFLTFKLPRVRRLSATGDGLVALAIAFLAFTAAEVLHGNGFVAVFVTAVSLRAYAPNNRFHRAMADSADQIERLLTMIILVLFGGTLATGLLQPLRWADVILGVALLLVIRPLTGVLGLWGSPHSRMSRGAAAVFGVRGVAALYYLLYAARHASWDHPSRVRATVAFAVLLSIVVHGLAAPPVTRWLDQARARRLKERAASAARP